MNFPWAWPLYDYLKLVETFEDLDFQIEKISQNLDQQNIEILDAICGRINENSLIIVESKKIILRKKILHLLEMFFSKNCWRKIDIQIILDFYSKQIKKWKKLDLEIEQIIKFLGQKN